LISELESYGVRVEVVDPFASPAEVKDEYGIDLTEDVADDYNAVIVAVSHKPYTNLSEDYFKSITSNNAIIVDVKGLYRNKIQELSYWSL